MLEEIIEDKIDRTSASNQPMFCTKINFDELASNWRNAIDDWKGLSEKKRKEYENQNDYMKRNGVKNINDPDLIPARNLSLVRNESKARINSNNIFRLLSIDTLDFDDSLIELAESIENIEEIRKLYRLRKRTTGSTKNAGINAAEAARMKNCFSQGRELFISGRDGSLMVKPLNFFYSLTAYTYGIIIINNPLRYRKDMLPGSHGMSFQPEDIQAQFGGDSPRGTFSDLVTAFPTHLVKTPQIEFNVDCIDSLLEFYENKFNVSLGTLLSMIPEMSEYYKLTTGNSSRCFPLEIGSANDPRTLIWEFYIGDGEYKPTIESIERSFPDFDHVDRHGKIVVTVPASRAASIKTCIYTDIRGNLWYLENPFFPVIIPEVALHFLILSIYSNIMRYRPDEWGNVVLNDVRSEISLITRHYYSTLQKKFMLLILRSITEYVPYASEKGR